MDYMFSTDLAILALTHQIATQLSLRPHEAAYVVARRRGGMCDVDGCLRERLRALSSAA